MQEKEIADFSPSDEAKGSKGVVVPPHTFSQKNDAQKPVQKGYKWRRNEPCFCGSGKKYKNCCMHMVEIDND